MTMKTKEEWQAIHEKVYQAQKNGSSKHAALESLGINKHAYYSSFKGDGSSKYLNSKYAKNVKEKVNGKTNKPFHEFVSATEAKIEITLPSGAVIKVCQSDTVGLKTVLNALESKES